MPGGRKKSTLVFTELFSTPLTGTALSERKNGNEAISSVKRALFRTSFPAVVNYTPADASP